MLLSLSMKIEIQSNIDKEKFQRAEKRNKRPKITLTYLMAYEVLFLEMLLLLRSFK